MYLFTQVQNNLTAACFPVSRQLVCVMLCALSYLRDPEITPTLIEMDTHAPWRINAK